MPSVFISREIRPESPFHDLDSNWEINAQSLLEFQAVEISVLPPADWYFFYSGKGASFFLKQVAPPTSVKLACLGRSAAAVLEEAGYHPDFVGNGRPEEVATEWSSLLRDKKIVFVQARQSRASVQKLLSADIDATELVVYDNQMRKVVPDINTDYLIFTSPLNFQAYIQHHEIREHQRVIGIGATTAVTFSDASVKDYRIAKEPSEVGLLECLLEWERE